MRVTVRVQSVVGHKNNSIARGQTDSESDTNIGSGVSDRAGRSGNKSSEPIKPRDLYSVLQPLYDESCG